VRKGGERGQWRSRRREEPLRRRATSPLYRERPVEVTLTSQKKMVPGRPRLPPLPSACSPPRPHRPAPREMIPSGVSWRAGSRAYFALRRPGSTGRPGHQTRPVAPSGPDHQASAATERAPMAVRTRRGGTYETAVCGAPAGRPDVSTKAYDDRARGAPKKKVPQRGAAQRATSRNGQRKRPRTLLCRYDYSTTNHDSTPSGLVKEDVLEKI
jgi:hypothetical protein